LCGLVLLASLIDVYKSYSKTIHFRNEIREMFGQGRSDTIDDNEIEQLIENNVDQSSFYI
jgi:hypothetical protein